MLPTAVAERQWRGPSWKQLFPRHASWPGPAASILLLVYLLSIAASPLLFAACSSLPDRGYSLGKIMGYLLTGWLAWVGACTPWISFSRAWILTAAAMLAGVGLVAGWFQRSEIRSFVRSQWPVLLGSEAVFIAAFVLMALLRRADPDLWQPVTGGEKPFDLSLLSAAVRAVNFPLYNPWYSGGLTNYYYFGSVLAGNLLKVAGVTPVLGYNVVLALLYGMTASAVFGIGYALTGVGVAARLRACFAALAVVLVLVLGNFKQAVLLISALARQPAALAARYYLDATRAYNHLPSEAQPINEFPFFTFYFGDLHPHLLAMPLFVAAIGFSAAIAAAPWKLTRGVVLLLAMAALVWGALTPVNMWDVPVAALLFGAAMWLSARRDAPPPRTLIDSLLLRWVTVLAAGWLCFAPFHQWFMPAFGSVARWTGSRTSFTRFLEVHGLFVSIAALGLFRAAGFTRRTMLGMAAAIAAAAIAGLGVTVLILLLLGVSGWIVWRNASGEPAGFVLVLLVAALLAVLLPEWFVLAGDAARMNTVFKFTFQAWTMFGISCAALAAYLAGQWRKYSHGSRAACSLAFAIMGMLALAYPVAAPFFRVPDKMNPGDPPTWDGSAFLERASLRVCGVNVALREDLGILRWLEANTDGTPIIAEYNADALEFGWGNRISAFTGLPAIAGWKQHLRLQMGTLEGGRLALRIQDVRRIYQPGDPAETWRLLEKYRVRYLVWGTLERACAAASEAKLAAGQGRLWDVVYHSNGGRICRIRDE
jgi:YYY domain-containing protein